MKFSLNIGCGNRTFKEYPSSYRCINYDFRNDLSSINIVGDAQLLPFKNKSFDYILASDIIEHFPIARTYDILNEWVRVLKSDSIIEFRLPNLEEICKDYLDKIDKNRSTGEPMAHYFSWLLYGGQDYPGNFHYVGFDRRLFKYVAERIKLKEIDYKKEGYNMVIKFRRQ